MLNRSYYLTVLVVKVSTLIGLWAGFIQDVTYSGYWSGLISSTDFTGKKLQQCLDVIHHDIVSIWNIYDSDGVRSFIRCPCEILISPFYST